ncbi:MAG TPA: M24 family metallopeptidase [Aurantimonas coralicida]|uniref:M24 family metallopeptidase n=2 Tax=root TaxID=1 RepID=A0A9C9NGD9_9HYPH|nr:M24 family metallopeptidase [Phycisphaerae bacterium]HEU00850.1 M24 family metallopeptidase [Aurantimonas coralicida]
MARLAAARSKDTHAPRRRSLARRLARENVQAMLLTRPQEVGYLCPFTGAGALLISAKWDVLITDSIHAEQAQRECPGLNVHVGGGSKFLAGLLKGRGIRRVGVHSDHVTLSAWLRLQDDLGPRRVVAVADLVGELRLIKDAGEIRTMVRAVKAAEAALRALLSRGRRAFVGRSEREVAAELDYRMSLAGADRPAFDTVVATGAAASQPHHRPSGRRIRRGEAVLIDWGANVAGYCSDLTRVIFTGRIPPQLAEIYEVVRQAQAAGARAIRPGVTAKSADAAARKVIEQAGYKDKFIHSFGHGLGREVHEAPPMAAGNIARLRAGMVVTVEPGIYLPGVGGVRLEDDVVVTSRGRRKLSSLPTDIKQMTL